MKHVNPEPKPQTPEKGENPGKTKGKTQPICKEEHSRECKIDPTFGNLKQRVVAIDLHTGEVIVNISPTCLKGKYLVIMMIGSDENLYMVGVQLWNNENVSEVTKFVIQEASKIVKWVTEP